MTCCKIPISLIEGEVLCTPDWENSAALENTDIGLMITQHFATPAWNRSLSQWGATFSPQRFVSLGWRRVNGKSPPLTPVDQSQHPLCPHPDRDVLIGRACWYCHLLFASLAPLHPCYGLGPSLSP